MRKYKLLSLILIAALLLSTLLALTACGEDKTLAHIVKNAKSVCTVVYPANDAAAKASAEALAAAITEKTGATANVVTDATSAAAEGYEILVGATNRPESNISALDLTEKDYFVGMKGNKLVLAGTSADTTAQAVTYAAETLIADGKLTPALDLAYTYLYAYPASAITLNGTPIQNYRIVYKDDAFDFAKEAAETMQAEIYRLTGRTLAIVTDAEEAVDCEILIGDTNRSESINIYTEFLAPTEYAYVADGNKLVINSRIYFLNTAVQTVLALMQPAGEFAPVELSISTTDIVSATFAFEEPKNAILLIGDGCGENHASYALENGLETYLPRLFPAQGYATTKSANSPITDSAASGTALATGYKTDNYMIGTSPTGVILKNLSELAQKMGKDVVVMSNDPITGATPAAFSAHTDGRYDTAGIEADQAAAGYLKLEGLGTIPSLEDSDAFFLSAFEAIEASANENGFFMMYEESYNDFGGHSNDFSIIYPAMERFNSVAYHALRYVLSHPDTILIITADHETGGVNKSPSGWGFSSTAHTAANVPVHAIGYGTEVFDTVICDNTDISKFIAYSLGADSWGDSKIPYKFEN